MDVGPIRALDPAIRALSRDIIQAPDQQIIRVAAMVDALPLRGDADQLLAPVRQRLARLKPPRPLRLPRLIFDPLQPLIVPAARWRIGQQAIPRTVIVPIADHIRVAMGPTGAAIETKIAGRTMADRELIAQLGQSLWPAVAGILSDPGIPPTWVTTELADAIYRPLADILAAIFAESAALARLAADSATGLLPPEPDLVEAILGRVAGMNHAAVPMTIALLLDGTPQAAELLLPVKKGRATAATLAAMDAATDTLLRQLDQEDGVETRIICATLPEAGAATRRMAMLLTHLADGGIRPSRREQIRRIRQRLDAACRTRFASGLRDEVLTALQDFGGCPGSEAILALETAARGLRVLGIEAGAIGSGPIYERLLHDAADAVADQSMRHGLALPDRLRLLEIIAGPGAALAMLDHER